MAELISKNRMSAQELVTKKNAPLELYDFTDNNGKNHVFFTCGRDFTMYGSPAAVKKFNEPDAKIEDFQFAEVSNDGGATFVPCLMVVGKSHTAKKTMGMELLRQQ